jgi:hypothetical protein
MGFDPISLAATAVSAFGGIQSANAAGEQAQIQQQAQQKAVADAANLVAQQKADQQATLRLSTAFNSLANLRAKSSGSASTMFANPGGVAGAATGSAA